MRDTLQEGIALLPPNALPGPCALPTASRCSVFRALLLLAVPVAAQDADPIPLYDNLGSHGRAITTSSAEAQRYFDQGMRLAYTFGRPEAVRSFREAQRYDPAGALRVWGEAWALGPYINEPMDSTAGRAAYRAAGQARSLAHQATDVKRALIDAMAARYAPVPTAANRAPLDSAYADAMREVVRRIPRDLDAGALFGEALMVLSPWDHWTAAGRPQPGTEEAMGVLESVLARDIRHPGACHLYIHLVESSPDPVRAEACADHLGAAIPGASHIQHMPSHIYMHFGRYGDSVRANQRAWQVDQQAAHGQADAARVDGQSAVALQAAGDLASMSPEYAFYPLLLRVRFGRWGEVLAAARPPVAPFHRGLRAFSRGMAHLRQAHADSARAYLDRLSALAEATPNSLTYGFVGHGQADLLHHARGILAGEVAASECRYTDAVGLIEQAIVREDALAYDEPEPWPLPARQFLGAVFLAADRPADAERVYRADLADYPNNGWSLFGLAQSLDAQGRRQEAEETRSAFEAAWARADVWLSSSRF